MENIKPRLYPAYILATIGDLAIILVSIVAIFYGTTIGLSTIEVGLLGSAYGFSYLIMPAILGRISDKMSHKTSLLIAATGHAILAIVLLSIISQPKEIIFIGFFLVLILYGIMFGFFWPTIEAYISENTEHSPNTHKKAIANFCIAWSIGYALGPLFAGVLTEYEIFITIIFALFLFIICFCVVLLSMPSSKAQLIISRDPSGEIRNPSSKLKEKASSIDAITLLILMGLIIYAIIEKLILLYFPNYAILSNGLDWTETLTGQVMLSFGIGRTLFFIIGRYFNNNFAAITQSLIILIPGLFLLIFTSDPWIIALIFFFLGFFIGRIYLVSLELLMKFEQEGKGGKAGLFESSIGFGSAFCPIIAGLLASINLILPFLIFAIIAFCAAILHTFLRKVISSSNPI